MAPHLYFLVAVVRPGPHESSELFVLPAATVAAESERLYETFHPTRLVCPTALNAVAAREKELIDPIGNLENELRQMREQIRKES